MISSGFQKRMAWDARQIPGGCDSFGRVSTTPSWTSVSRFLRANHAGRLFWKRLGEILNLSQIDIDETMKSVRMIEMNSSLRSFRPFV